MLRLKEFYQYKREIKKGNQILQSQLVTPLPSLKLAQAHSNFLAQYFRAILYIKTSKSNTSFTLTNLKGKVQVRQSCGAMGFQGKKKRSSKLALDSSLQYIAAKAYDLGCKELLVNLNGYGKTRFSLIKTLKKYKLKVVGIRDITPNPHNGCRPKKRRRI